MIAFLYSLSIGAQRDLTDHLYRLLSKKYYWRKWYVVVYPKQDSDVYVGRNNNWMSLCKDEFTYKNLIWKNKYTILISSSAFPKTDEEREAKVKQRKTDMDSYDKKVREYNANGAFDRLSPNIKNCKLYPLVSLTRHYTTVTWAADETYHATYSMWGIRKKKAKSGWWPEKLYYSFEYKVHIFG